MSRRSPSRAARAILAAALSAGAALQGGAARAAPPPPLERASIADIDAAHGHGPAVLRAAGALLSGPDRAAGPGRAIGLHAVIALNPDALAQARALDAERRAGHVRGPLHGVPILVKDNIETADPIATTAGSLALAANVTAPRRAGHGGAAAGGGR